MSHLRRAVLVVALAAYFGAGVASAEMPCSAMPDSKIKEVLFLESLGLKEETLAQMMQQLRSCLVSNEVCIVGLRNNKNVLGWSAKTYARANLSDKFDVNEELYIGVVQLLEKDKKSPVCIFSINNLMNATPWNVEAWQITDGESKQVETNPYSYGDYQFTIAMTPHSLSKAMVTWYRYWEKNPWKKRTQR
jgi:hypothetical protein